MDGQLPAWQEFMVRVVVVLVIALALSPMIRGLTADMTMSVGRTWPFVMEHCRTPDTPGCAYAEPGQFLQRLAVR